ncbi:MAG: AAA family ATPase, partial [Mycobacteriales bacterium]
MERLLTAAGVAAEADAVRKLRLDHQRVQYETETRKVVKAAASISVPGTGVKAWRDVITPHPDVAAGHYTQAEFAADLHYAARGDAETDYVDPVQFFRRTYLTEGLRDLLGRAARRLTGDMNASPVVNLQTNFGGGKTHSMLALWHLLSGTPIGRLPQEVQDVVGDRTLPAEVRRVALVGTELKPGQAEQKPDGTRVRTMWGELSWQLGGADAFAMLAESDA